MGEGGARGGAGRGLRRSLGCAARPHPLQIHWPPCPLRGGEGSMSQHRLLEFLGRVKCLAERYFVSTGEAGVVKVAAGGPATALRLPRFLTLQK